MEGRATHLKTGHMGGKLRFASVLTVIGNQANPSGGNGALDQGNEPLQKGVTGQWHVDYDLDHGGVKSLGGLSLDRKL